MLESSDLADHIQDEGFHEIQLSGKQLVFLFMAATVVSVVIFLCGVLVGRGVRAERGGTVADATIKPGAPGSASPSIEAPQTRAAAPPAAGSDPTMAAPPPTVDDLTYFNRLEKPKTVHEDLKPNTPAKPVRAEARPPVPASPQSSMPEKSAGQPGRASSPTAPRTAPPSAAAEPMPSPGAGRARATPPPARSETPDRPDRGPAPRLTPAAGDPSGLGYSIQIAALGDRSDADALAKTLASKGYTAYVVPPASGAPAVFRVRVGKFNSRREAESVATKLEREEHFRPWITR